MKQLIDWVYQKLTSSTNLNLTSQSQKNKNMTYKKGVQKSKLTFTNLSSDQLLFITYLIITAQILLIDLNPDESFYVVLQLVRSRNDYLVLFLVFSQILPFFGIFRQNTQIKILFASGNIVVMFKVQCT